MKPSILSSYLRRVASVADLSTRRASVAMDEALQSIEQDPNSDSPPDEIVSISNGGVVTVETGGVQVWTSIPIEKALRMKRRGLNHPDNWAELETVEEWETV